jgi:hypothetical protein
VDLARVTRPVKFNIEIDCTPEEARKFLGLPDVVPFQQVLMDSLQRRLTDFVATTDPKTLMDQWMPIGFKSLEQWPQVWAQMAAAAASGFPKPPPKPKKD